MSKPIEVQLLQARNQAIRKWFNAQVTPLAMSAVHLGIKPYSGQFYSMFKTKIYQRNGKVIGGGYGMPRHAIYVHKGVGRGYPIELAGGGITRKKAAERLTNKGYNKTAISNYLAVIMAGKHNKKRKPKPWFNPVIDRNLPVLANEVQKHDANIISERIFIQ